MADIASRGATIPILILEHSYSYEAFNSWWFIYKRSGLKYRVVFDGKENYLLLQEAVTGNDRKLVVEWRDSASKKIASHSHDTLLADTYFLISGH